MRNQQVDQAGEPRHVRCCLSGAASQCPRASSPRAALFRSNRSMQPMAEGLAVSQAPRLTLEQAPVATLRPDLVAWSAPSQTVPSALGRYCCRRGP